MTAAQGLAALAAAALSLLFIWLRRRELQRSKGSPELRIHPYLMPEGEAGPKRYGLLIKNEGSGQACHIGGTIEYRDVQGQDRSQPIFTNDLRLDPGECILKKGIFPIEHPPAASVLVNLRWKNRLGDDFKDAVLLAPQRFEAIAHTDLYFSNIVMEL